MHSPLRESVDTPVRGVRIWRAHLDSLSPGQVDELRVHLDPAECARAARFHFERDRQCYVTARGLLRCLLGERLKTQPSTIAFEYGAHGKPALDRTSHRDSAICFNLSHSAGWAMFAITEDREIGIDLEGSARLDRSEDDLSRLATRVLSANEFAIWQALPQSDRRAAFLRAWTRKEACTKANGRGVFDDLASIEVALDAAAPRPSLIVQSPANAFGLTNSLLLYDLAAPEGFAAALAVAEQSGEDVACGSGAVFASESNA